MRFIVSSVEFAKVDILDNNLSRSVWKWLLVYVWISKQDCEDKNIDERIQKAVKKLTNLKLINDEQTDKISLSVKDINGEILLISNFTLYGRNKKGNKMDFLDSGWFSCSKRIYDKLLEELSKEVLLKTWEFGAKMKVYSENLWPLNYVLEI